MKPRQSKTLPARRQAGYALLLAMFFAALLLLASVVAVPRILTQGKREKEGELIWRGEQYARGVRLYYRKFGRFPQSLEDLTKAKNELRFMRKAYKDPMNAQDGSWRLIYVGPNGQIVGSVKRHTVLQGLGAAPTPQAPQQPANPSTTAQDPHAGTDTSGAPATPTNPATPGTSPTSGTSATPAAPSGTSTDIPEGKVFGGNIIGVGSKVDRVSIRIYDGGTNYHEWEFLWDPTKEPLAAAPTAGVPPGKGPGGSPQTPQNPTSPQNPQFPMNPRTPPP